jgi:hypothetical protein
MKKKSNCLECGETLHGRSDKKFCNAICRNRANNERNAYSTNYMRKVHSSLRSNKRILERLLEEKTSIVVDRADLYREGFDFSVYTGASGTKDIPQYHCYELRYEETGIYKVKITRLKFKPK